MCVNTNCTESAQNAVALPSISSISFESLLTLAQAAKVIPRPNGRQVTVATLWRWCRKGINGVYLEHLCIGRTIVTDKEALNRFFHNLANIDGPLSPHNPHNRKRVAAEIVQSASKNS